MKITIVCDCGESLTLQPGVDYEKDMMTGKIIDVWTEWTVMNVNCCKCGKSSVFDINGY